MREQNVKIVCQRVYKIFGPHPETISDSMLFDMSKEEILEKTGHVLAVKDVSFTVSENEIFVIMGLSGSGKSTLVRCVNRLIDVTRGVILIDGVDVGKMTANELREMRRYRLSMVFQAYGLLPNRNVFANAAFGLELRGESKAEVTEKVMQTLELVGLKGWEKAQIHELSGGMQQRVGLARALAVGSQILIMDEPFSALDPLIRRQMQDEFLKLHDKIKRTVVFITHDFAEAIKLGTRIVLMKDGEIIQVGAPEDIVINPANEYVTNFVKDMPKGKIITARSIMQRPEVVVRNDEGIDVTIKRMKAKGADLAFIISASGTFKKIVSMKQLLVAADKGVTDIEEIEQLNVTCVNEKTSLDKCIAMIMQAEKDSCLVVLSEKKEFAGVVYPRALARAAVE